MSGTSGAHNLFERSAERWQEFSDWVSANSLDLGVAALAAAFISLLLIALRSVGHRLIRDRDQRIGWRTVFGRVLAKTSLFFIAMCAIKLVSAQAAAPPSLQRTIDILFTVAAAFQAAIWARELVLGLIQQRVDEDEPPRTLSSAVGVIRVLVSVALFAIAIILILDNVGVDVTGLVAGLGIGGIAIGLAAQGIFRDLFAALSIIFDKPFRRGDVIKVDQLNGTVEEIGLKSTRLRSVTGEQIVISNARLLERDLHNFAQVARRRLVLTFRIAYATPPEACARIPDIARAVVERHKSAAYIRCGVTGFGESGLDHELQFEVRSADYEEVFAVRAAIVIAMLEAFNQQDIAFAELA